MKFSSNSIIILLISLISVNVDALTDETSKIVSALKGRTYFAPRESVSASTAVTTSASSSAVKTKTYSSSSAALAPRRSVKVPRAALKYIESESQSESESSESVSESESSSSESQSIVQDESIAESEISFSESTDSSMSSTVDSDDSCSSSSSSEPACRLSRRPSRSLLALFNYQRPWCPGQVMASLTTRALDPIYDWRNPLTCAQFASNLGGVSVVVGELDGPVFCQAGPTDITSQYTIVRSLSINNPIYARALKDDVEFAVAAGPIFYPQGLVYYISVAKEVSKLPQVCN